MSREEYITSLEGENERLKRVCSEFIWAEEHPHEYKSELEQLGEQIARLKEEKERLKENCTFLKASKDAAWLQVDEYKARAAKAEEENETWRSTMKDLKPLLLYLDVTDEDGNFLRTGKATVTALEEWRSKAEEWRDLVEKIDFFATAGKLLPIRRLTRAALEGK